MWCMGCFTRKSDELGELGDVGKQIEKLHLAGAFNPDERVYGVLQAISKWHLSYATKPPVANNYFISNYKLCTVSYQLLSTKYNKIKHGV